MQKTNTRILKRVLIGLAVFVFAVIVESHVRSLYKCQMEIAGLPIGNARVVGSWTPDFLWAGKAWRIELQSDEELELILDGQTFVIPRGLSEIYSNQDHTNTGEFGSQPFWGYPEEVEVRRVVR